MTDTAQDSSATYVLMVEDNHALAELYRLALTWSGYTVTIVDNAAAAIAAMDNQRPDLVVTDVMLPGGSSGIDLLLLLTSTHPGLPVAVMSANDDPALRASALSHGASVFLLKPFKLEELVQALTSLIEARSRPPV